MSLLRVEDLSFAYDKVPVFKHIDFEVEKGQVICLVGSNGCGKTTLLDCLIGANKAESGDVIINGLSHSKIDMKEKAKMISYIPQKHRESFPYRVREMVIMGRAPYISAFGTPDKEDQEIAVAAMKGLGIEDFSERLFSHLSGGEAQMVLIARALTQEAPIIAMDEPTSSLDFKNETLILETVVKLVKEKKVSIIMATHFPNHSFYFENNGIDTKVLMMKDGQIKHSGQPIETITEENILDVYGVNAKIVTYDHEGREERVVIPMRTSK